VILVEPIIFPVVVSEYGSTVEIDELAEIQEKIPKIIITRAITKNVTLGLLVELVDVGIDLIGAVEIDLIGVGILFVIVLII
jgi:hypothetical protein